MKTSTLFRTSLSASLLTIAFSANATSIYLLTSGIYLPVEGIPGNTFFGGNESVVIQDGGYGPLDNMQYTFAVKALPRSGSGRVQTIPPDGQTPPAERIDFDLTISGYQFITPELMQLDGTWTVTDGLGSYAHATGGGVVAVRIDLLSHQSYSIWQGNLDAVPEPASLVALGLGCVVLARRRRR